MLKKVTLSVLLVGLVGILVAGAINRTIDTTEKVAEARSLSQGRGRGQETSDAQSLGQSKSVSNQAIGHDGSIQTDGMAEIQVPSYRDTPEEWVLYEGVVARAPAAGEDLLVATGSGEQVVVGIGQGYLANMGFSLQVGEQVQVQGYRKDGEFKVAQVTRLRDGETITLRDELGLPTWTGKGRNAQAGAWTGYGGRRSTKQLGEETSTRLTEEDE